MTAEWQSIERNRPAPGKSCGSCTLCCKLLGITALEKPQGTWCRHCNKGSGCKIYSERPDECKTFFCLWLVDPHLGPEWKPNLSKMVVTFEENGLDIHCDTGYPLAWQREPYHQHIQEWAIAARPHSGFVRVCVGNQTSLIELEGEFPLGTLADDDRIVREFEGSRLVGVRVVKASELPPR